MMMNWLKTAFHFLGGIYFALILIALAALFVITGTVLEAYTDSHLYAAQWTYHHPFFALLLSLFFVNILTSSLRRWPFKTKHTPFLLTHLGLLMVIAGTLLKNQYGIQGQMHLIEGSGSQTLLLPHTYAIYLEKKATLFPLSRIYPFSLKQGLLYPHPQLPQVKLKIKDYSSHASEELETWIKGNQAYISGLPPFPVQQWPTADKTLTFQPVSFHEEGPTWEIAAIHTSQIQETLNDLYLRELKITLASKENPLESYASDLSEALQNPFAFDQGTVHLNLHLPFSPLNGIEKPIFKMEWKALDTKRQENIKVDLEGDQALHPQLEHPNWIGMPSFHIDFKRSRPRLALIEDNQGDCYIYVCDEYGRVHLSPFTQAHLKQFIIYDRGFGGYAAQVALPLSTLGRAEQEKAELAKIEQQLREIFKTNPPLSPPLKLLKEACEKAGLDPTTTFLQFLKIWSNSHQLLFPLENSFDPALNEHLNWDAIPQDKKACEWICLLIDRVESDLKEGKDLLTVLQEHRWPFISELIKVQDKGENLLTAAMQYFFGWVPHLPPLPSYNQEIFPGYQGRLLSAYFRAHGITYETLFPRTETKVEALDPSSTHFMIETPITTKHYVEPLTYKLEDQRPRVTLEISTGELKQKISLAYNALGTGLKWPVLGGEYVVRFQPQLIEIPYRIRLRQARQFNYADSSQPYSYEADILVSKVGEQSHEAVLSMNRVYETWDGYRFYLAGMSPATESGTKSAQIIVNYDPAKYILTYPGACLVALGSGLLFWGRRSSKKS